MKNEEVKFRLILLFSSALKNDCKYVGFLMRCVKLLDLICTDIVDDHTRNECVNDLNEECSFPMATIIM